jgi:hypothetical protein
VFVVEIKLHPKRAPLIMKADGRAYVEQMQANLKAAVLETAFHIERKAKRLAPRDTSRLASAIHVETDVFNRPFRYTDNLGNSFDGTLDWPGKIGLLSALVGARVTYSVPVHEGSRANFPPIQNLAGWAARHGMKGKEYAIARSIASRARPGIPFLRMAVESERSKFQTRVVNAMRNK